METPEMKYVYFRPEFSSAVSSGKAKVGKCFEVMVHPADVEASVILGAKYFLLTRGIK